MSDDDVSLQIDTNQDDAPSTKEESWKDDDFLSFGDNNNDDTDQEKGSSTSELAAAALSSTPHCPPATHRNRQDPSSSVLNESLTAVNELPPWMDHYHETRSKSSSRRPYHHSRDRYEYNHIPKLINLHNEIVSFASLMAPQPSELEQRKLVTEKVQKLVLETFGKEQCSIQVFGSQATGLQLPTSDIDFVIHLPGYNPPDPDKKEGDDAEEGDDADDENKGLTQAQKDQLEMDKYDSSNAAEHQSPLQRLGQALRDSWKDDLTYLEILENTRIPIVKFTHGPTNLSVDVCFNQTAGVQAADLMKRFMEAMPPLRPLTFVLKYFLAARGLNEPYSGGCGSFCIQMMIVSFLQHRERDLFNRHHNGYEDDMGHYNLGALLMEFLQLYGMDFNYVTTGISVRSDGFYFRKGDRSHKDHFWQPGRPFSLALENPFDLTGDVGKPSFRMQLIQRSFDVALKVLLSHVAEPAVPTVSFLATILPPNAEMYQRATMFKVSSIEAKIRKQGYEARSSAYGGSKHSKRRKLSNIDSDMDTD